MRNIFKTTLVNSDASRMGEVEPVLRRGRGQRCRSVRRVRGGEANRQPDCRLLVAKRPCRRRQGRCGETCEPLRDEQRGAPCQPACARRGHGPATAAAQSAAHAAAARRPTHRAARRAPGASATTARATAACTRCRRGCRRGDRDQALLVAGDVAGSAARYRGSNLRVLARGCDFVVRGRSPSGLTAWSSCGFSNSRSRSLTRPAAPASPPRSAARGLGWDHRRGGRCRRKRRPGPRSGEHWVRGRDGEGGWMRGNMIVVVAALRIGVQHSREQLPPRRLRS